MRKLQPADRAFTLIELLVVVAIIGILAAIALPNFLRAMGKAKVSRCISDMRSLSIAMEAYHIDFNAYPPDSGLPGIPIDTYPWDAELKAAGIGGRLELMCLTSPIAYMSAHPGDPMHSEHQYGAGRKDAYAFSADKGLWGVGPIHAAMKKSGRNWIIISCGPDRDLDFDEFRMNPGLLTDENLNLMLGKKHPVIYFPTNGLISSGDIPWLQGVGITEGQ